MSSNKNPSNVVSLASHSSRFARSAAGTVAALRDRLDDCDGSEDYVAVIRALAATRDPAAIDVLASLLDSTGPIAEQSIVSLLTFGEAAVPAMRKCVDSLDYEMIHHGHRVLAALGNEASAEWLVEDGADRDIAYLESQGVDPEAWCDFVLETLERIANETAEEDESA
jgi:hypothetical protein